MIVIAGSGIFGLALAEAFSSLGHCVKIVSTCEPLAGSYAAGALLATKAQAYARDPHFELKLRAKRVYKTWTDSLLTKASSLDAWRDFPRHLLYREGVALERFETATTCEDHIRRIQQPHAELRARGLGPQEFKRIDSELLQYENEASVDAIQLCNLLHSVCKLNGVEFVHDDILSFIKTHNDKVTKLFLCTGPWTVQLLRSLGVDIPPLLKKERRTLGSTFFWEEQKELPHVYEQVHNSEGHSCTLSTFENRGILSSSTLRLSSTESDDIENLQLAEKNEQLWRVTSLLQSDVLQKKTIAKKATGLRVGFGHTEIFVNEVRCPNLRSRVIVCAGAHKSGYLFAPMIFECVQNLQSLK